MTTAQAIRVTIDQCYCEHKSFDALITIARQEQLSLRALAAKEGCGTHCGWCVAYLRRALVTGEMAFHDLLDKESLDDFPLD